MVGFFSLWMGALLHVCQPTIYTNDWAIKIRGDLESVDRIAKKYGFTNMGQVSSHRRKHQIKRQRPSLALIVFCYFTHNHVSFEVEWIQQQVVLRREMRSIRSSQIYSSDGTSGQHPFTHHRNQTTLCQTPMNIGRAWRRGYTGKGVVVSVLADGIERRHPDIKSHGTRCAQMVAAPVNASKCSVGVSFHTRIGGIRMLDGDVTDMIEAQSLNFRPQHIDIYLAGWGPEDNGRTLEGPGFLTGLALQNGIQKGRRGRGSVYVWPSGNGGRRGDHCSCDGYSSSIYTISISSSSLHGVPPDYVERCSSTLAASYSGVEMEEGVTLGAQTGTSLSSSVAAASLTLLIHTSHHLVAPDWHVNGAGYKVSHVYGFGLLDAEAMVKEAQRWKRVASHHVCVEEADIQPSRIIHPGSALTSVHWTTGCVGEASQHVVYAEHVVVPVTLTHRRRGDLSITLKSPSGTVSQLLANRPLDSSTEGFQDWEFMTTHCWGEKAAGKWTLTIQDTSSQKRDGLLNKWSLVIYGTSELPHPRHRKRARSTETLMDSDLTEEYSGPCDPECSDDGCEGPSPQHCVTCLHFFLKFKNNTRVCVTACPKGFWEDRRRCKRCYSSCESCTGSRSDQCTSCQPGHHLTEDTNTCTTTCEDNYYLDHDVNMCRKCSENCLKCISYNICTECKPDTSLYGNQCQQSCAPGFYHDSLEGTCKACDQACATCAGAGLESCKQCAEGFLMEEWRCVSSCSNGFYATEAKSKMADGHSMCRRCDASCLTCAGPGQGNCSSCSSGHSLQEGVCVVSSACTDGEYHDNNGECHTCDATCLKCTGPGNQDCISCASSGVLDEGRCVEACSVGKYPSGGQCHLCDHTCATCVDSASCTSCDTDKFGLERYLFKGWCVEACPRATYHTKQRSCESCMPHCLLCTSLQHCLQCTHSHYPSDGQCVKLECGEGEVEDPDYDECMACEEGCKKCVLYNPRHCLSCIEGFYNFQEGCYRNCPAQTYSVEEGMTCVPCEENCVSCDEHECYWCEDDHFLSGNSFTT
uniref:Proprotein convertase subtilisin/kexin type 5-like n=1 Tax=Gouania willdenowi TaxID=441366 RepID=A0A8C5ELX1_GOUWI